MTDIRDLVQRRDWHDDLGARQEFLRQWFAAPRQVTEDTCAPEAPEGYAPCPVPSAGSHLLIEGHVFTEDGRCWVPDER